jgi:hypothetical protein
LALSPPPEAGTFAYTLATGQEEEVTHLLEKGVEVKMAAKKALLGRAVLVAVMAAALAGQGVAEEVQVPLRSLEKPPKAFLSGLGQVFSAVADGPGVAFLTQDAQGRLSLVRAKGMQVLSRVSLEKPSEGDWDYPRLLAVAEDLALVDAFSAGVLFRNGKVVRSFPTQAPLVGAQIHGENLVLFSQPVPDPRTSEEEPLVMLQSLSGSEEEVWLRARPRKEQDPLSIYQAVDGVVTKDGGLWTVGVYDGEVRRFDRQGKVRWQGQLPLPEEKEDPEAVAQLKEELKAQALKDATRRPPTSVEVELAPQERVAAVGRWNDSLGVVAKGAAAGKVFVVRDNPPEMLSFQLPESLAPQPLAVTAEGLWFWEPLGLLPWSTVEEQLGKK